MGWQIELKNGTLNKSEFSPSEPGPGEVQVAIEASSLNYRDVGIMLGHYPAKEVLVPLSDGAGTVVSVGPGVDQFKVGDLVHSNFYPFWTGGSANQDNHRASLGCELDGMLRSAANLPASAVHKAPVHLSAMEAATLPCAGVTAWSALFVRGELRPGEHVLIQGTGGVAIFALQIAKATGAEVTVISSSNDKLDRVKQLGADHVLNYTEAPNWGQTLNEQHGGPAIDLVLELGGEHTLGQSMECLRVNGRISVIGLLSGMNPSFSIPTMLQKQLRMSGVTVGDHEATAALGRFLTLHNIRPVIDDVIDHENAARCYEAMMAAKHFGKLVIKHS